MPENPDSKWDAEIQKFLGVAEGHLDRLSRSIMEIEKGIGAIQTNTEKAVEEQQDLVRFYREGGSGQHSLPPNAWTAQANRSVPGVADLSSLIQQAAGPSLGASSGASSATRTPQQVAAELDEKPFEVPSLFGGQWNAQSLAEFGQQITARLGAWQARGNTFLGQFGGSGQAMAKTSDVLGSFATNYAPAFSIAKNYGQKLYQMGQGFTTYGETLGAVPGESATNVGPLRLPTGATIKGITTGISDWWQGLSTPGLSSSQIANTREQLAQLGWYSGDQAAQMNTVGRQLTQFDPMIGQNPLTYQMMDKTVRHGNASLQEFEQTMKNIPDAARAAHISFEQLQTDMDAFGEANQQRGGTYYQGTQLAQNLASATGQPPSAVQNLVTSPYAQGMIMSQTGLPPWAQGTLSPEIQTALGVGSFQSSRQLVAGMGGSSFTIPGTGFKEHVSAVEQQAAYLHQFIYPDMNPETIQEMLKHPQFQKSIEAGQNLGAAFRTFSESVGQADSKFVRDKTPANAKGVFDATSRVHDLQNLMRKARDPVTGKQMFNEDDIHNVMQAGGYRDLGEWLQSSDQDSIRQKLMNQGILKPGQNYDDIIANHPNELHKIRASVAKYQASDSMRAYHDLVASKEADDKSTSETASKSIIDLSPAAKRFFQLQSPQSAAKLNEAAGGGIPRASTTANGPTPSPMYDNTP